MDKGEREWTKFQVGALGKHQGWRPSCKPIDFMSHVSHLNNAVSIFETGKITAGLVFDESILRKKRILVVWLSPNDWHGAGGFRYGNVRFNFNCKKLVDGMNYYWIEIMPYPKIPACRILITEKDYSGKFPEYDPTQGDGPWWHRTKDDTHFFNGNICLEIMIQRDVYLTEMDSFDFVDHSSKYCTIDRNNCPDLNLYRAHAGARFIAALAGRDADFKIEKFFKKNPDKIGLSELKAALSILWQDLRAIKEFSGDVKSTDDAAVSMSRAVLNCYGKENDKEMHSLASLFRTHKGLERSCARLIGSTLNIPAWTDLIEKPRRR